MKKVLITGATGFIGSHLVERNIREGNKIKILALPGDKKALDFKSRGIDVVYGDIREPSAVNEAVSDIQIVFHLSGVVTDWTPKEIFDKVNIRGTRSICEACLQKNVDRLIEVSTNDVFGLKENVVINESFDFSSWGEPYADTKLEASRIVWEYGKKGLPVSIVYPCWVYGPGDTTFVPLLAYAIKNGRLLFWRKNAIVWPAYVENLVDLIMVLAEHPKAVGQGFIYHDGESDTLQNFTSKIVKSIGKNPSQLYIPYWTAYAAACIMESLWKLFRKKSRPLLTTYTVKNLGSRLKFSIEKAERELGWVPPLSYQKGLKKTMDWLKQTNTEQWKQK